MTAQIKIDEYIGKLQDWRGHLIKEIRECIHEIEPDIEEEWKWSSPVFSFNGKMVCSPSAFKTHVGLNFFNGAMIKDTTGLFNGGLESKKSRTINFKVGSKIDKRALKALLIKAIDFTKG